jgi:hypothetical protein
MHQQHHRERGENNSANYSKDNFDGGFDWR